MTKMPTARKARARIMAWGLAAAVGLAGLKGHEGMSLERMAHATAAGLRTYMEQEGVDEALIPEIRETGWDRMRIYTASLGRHCTQAPADGQGCKEWAYSTELVLTDDPQYPRCGQRYAIDLITGRIRVSEMTHEIENTQAGPRFVCRELTTEDATPAQRMKAQGIMRIIQESEARPQRAHWY